MKLSQHAISRFSKRTGRSLEKSIPALYALVARGEQISADEVFDRYGLSIHDGGYYCPTTGVCFHDDKIRKDIVALVRNNVVVTVLVAQEQEEIRIRFKEGRNKYGRVHYNRVIRTLADDVVYKFAGKGHYDTVEKRGDSDDGTDNGDDSVL